VTLVVDASFLVALLTDAGNEGRWAESIAGGGELVAPELAMVETANILRRLEAAGLIGALESELAYRDLLRLDLQLFPFVPFSTRIWELRKNLTAYDAWYVALAEALGCPLATLDRKLKNATGVACQILTCA